MSLIPNFKCDPRYKVTRHKLVFMDPNSSRFCCCFFSSHLDREDAQRDLRPHPTRRPPGLLRGGRAVPSAPYVDGQSHRGVCRRHLPMGEQPAAPPRRNLPRFEPGGRRENGGNARHLALDFGMMMMVGWSWVEVGTFVCLFSGL